MLRACDIKYKRKFIMIIILWSQLWLKLDKKKYFYFLKRTKGILITYDNYAFKYWYGIFKKKVNLGGIFKFQFYSLKKNII